MALSLPPEMFPPIFANLKLFDLVRVSHVCSYWRSICLGAPYLWSDFDAAGCRKTFLEAIIARSKSVPLHLEANHDELYTADVVGDELLRAHSESVTEEYFMTTFLPPLMVRMKSLFLSNFNRTLGVILVQPAPMLLGLVLRSVNGHLCDDAIRGRDAPVFPKLKSLALDSINFCGTFTLGHFLLLCPQVEKLVIELPNMGHMPDRLMLSGQITNYAPRLCKILLLGEPRDTGLNVALLDSVRNVYVMGDFDEPEHALVLASELFNRLSSPARRLHVTTNSAGVITESGFERSMDLGLCAPGVFMYMFMKLSLFDSVTFIHLNVAICGVAFLHRFPPAPLLRQLVLEHCGPFQLSGSQRRRWSCPSLTTLILLGHSHKGGCTCGRASLKVKLANLRVLLRDVLGFSKNRLLALLAMRDIKVEGCRYYAFDRPSSSPSTALSALLNSLLHTLYA